MDAGNLTPSAVGRGGTETAVREPMHLKPRDVSLHLPSALHKTPSNVIIGGDWCYIGLCKGFIGVCKDL